jgi:retron-type reverse transcriptase
LFDRILDRDNLRLAFSKALQGKRARPEAREFAADLEQNLSRMQSELSSGTLEVGRFRQFVIRDPKERIITAPCFAERILHHAVMNVCEPVFDRWLIDDTFVCRRRKGRLAALQRTLQFAGRFPCFLKLDIRKYFDSVAHARLLQRLERRFKDRKLLALFESIIGNFRGEMGRGLPIGSLTSQHFANFYLGWFDRFVKERLRVPGYVRYMDDMVIWGESTDHLRAILELCSSFLIAELELNLKPPHLNRTAHGMDFLGCRVFPGHIKLNARSPRRFQRKLLRLESEFLAGEIGEPELQQRGTALVAFTRGAGVVSWRFRSAVLQRMPVSGHEARTG